LRRFWEAYFAPMDPNNLIWMGWKWRHGDVSRHTSGDLAAALGRIKAKTYVVPFSRDMFFPPDDCEPEQKLIPDSKFRVVDSLAHFAMFCMTKSDREQIETCWQNRMANLNAAAFSVCPELFPKLDAWAVHYPATIEPPDGYWFGVAFHCHRA
jgi:hypothetical protein